MIYPCKNDDPDPEEDTKNAKTKTEFGRKYGLLIA